MIEAIQLFSYFGKCGLHVYNFNEKCKIKIIFGLECCKYKFLCTRNIKTTRPWKEERKEGRKEGREGRKDGRKGEMEEGRFSVCAVLFFIV